MEFPSSHSTGASVQPTEPWQLQMFRRSLKKQQKLRLLLDVLGNVDGQNCLLMTCGDNNGALNWYFKEHGGTWAWVDVEHDSIEQISALTGDPVIEVDKDHPMFPFSDGHFDAVITIDVHEHLKAPGLINQEIARLVKSGGKVIVTTPNGDQRKPANRIKKMLGMTPEAYGHVVAGYDIPDLEQQLKQAGLNPCSSSSYSRFFTEMLELMINFAYVKILSKRSQAQVSRGQIAPQNKDQFESVGQSYKIYSLLYPFFLAFSKLDHLIRFSRGYAVAVEARKV